MNDVDHPQAVAARQALGLRVEEVMGAQVEGASVVLVTVGGFKTRWTPGAPTAPLCDFHAGRRVRREELRGAIVPTCRCVPAPPRSVPGTPRDARLKPGIAS